MEEKLDKTIGAICDRITREIAQGVEFEEIEIGELARVTTALAELVTARAYVKSPENYISIKRQCRCLKQ